MLEHLLLLQSFFFCLFTAVHSGGRLTGSGFSAEENPFTAKASLVRYWNKEIRGESPSSEFLVSKASPLNAVNSATFAKLAAENSLPTRLPDFCSAANLFCLPDLSPSLEQHNDKNRGSAINVRFRSYRFIIYHGGKTVNKWIEPRKFFRESVLKEGTVIPMPDIKDKMPKRSFLPQSIISKLPFSTSKLNEIKKIFHALENSTMEGIITDAVTECERPPNVGETKRCVGSAEDMIHFATSVLGQSVVLRTTENVAGSKQKVMVGKVKGINGGKLTKAVSCHQSLYPYLLYYCHSVRKVQVYEADLLEMNSKKKINQGIAICHMDTSSWGPSHEAFPALGSKPGRIEVCHWIFENDINWVIAD